MASPSLDRRLGLTGNKAYKAPCDVATTTNITLSGEQTIDGVVTSGSRVLVWNQTNAVDNGIWDSSTGSWSRAIDCNTNQDLAKGTQVYVSGGTAYAGNRFVFNSSNPIQPGTSSITIAQSTDSSTLQARLADPTSASNGDEMVAVKLVATGSVARTQHGKNAEWVSVNDFGAVADGNASSGAGTDNAAAFILAEEYAHSTGVTIFIPSGVYILRSQVTLRSGVNFIGQSMYNTILIAPNTFTGEGIVYMPGGSGVPSTLKSCAILGATATGAGAGSVGVKLTGNACKIVDCWVGGFFAQIVVGGTDCHCLDCWADVSLASGYGVIVNNGGNIVRNTVVFNCYVGFYVSADGYWATSEPDIGVRLIGCQAIQCGFDGLTIVNGLNVQVIGMQFHSPTTASKFTRSFIRVEGGSNIAIDNVSGTFGNAAASASTVGVSQSGTTRGFKLTNSYVKGCLKGLVAADIPGGVVSCNSIDSCAEWNYEVQGASKGLCFTGNVGRDGGLTNASGYGNFKLTTGSASGGFVVSCNSSLDTSGSAVQYGFFITCDAAAQVIMTGNSAVSGHATPYNLAGTLGNIRQNENVPDVLKASATYDPPSLGDGAGATTTVTVTGAALGDWTQASFSLDLQGITLTSWVSAANTVSVRFQNESGGTLDLASGTLRVAARH